MHCAQDGFYDNKLNHDVARSHTWLNVGSAAIACVCLAALVGMGAHAQEFRSEIGGTVYDQTNSPVPGAEVVVTNEETGVRASMRTGDRGQYHLLQLLPGKYRVTVSVPGFKTLVRYPVELKIASRLVLNFNLEVGDLQQQIVVTASTPLVNTSDGSINQVISQKEIVDLPINGRNVYALLALSADVQPQNPSRFAQTQPSERLGRSQFSVSGSPTLTNEILLNGVPNSEAGKLVGIPVTPDVVQEFKVESNFDAEYGYSLGAVVNAVSKSGSNQFHGTAYEFLRNDVLRAQSFFANKFNLQKPPFRFNQYGSSIGGPIVKNKAFFFGNYEAIRQRIPSAFLATVPTDLQRAGDFSQTVAPNGGPIRIFDPLTTRASGNGFIRDQFPGNRIPASMVDPVSRALISYFPTPNRTGDPVTGANNFAVSGANRTTYDTLMGRVDYQITDNQKIFAHYAYAHPLDTPFNPFQNEANPNSINELNNHNFALDYSHVASPTLVFDLRFGASRFRSASRLPRGAFDMYKLNLPKSFVESVPVQNFPTFNVQDATRLGPIDSGLFSTNNYFTLHGNTTKIVGSHTTKFGFDRRFNQANNYTANAAAGVFNFNRNFTQGPNPLQASVTSGYGVASLLLGTGTGSTDNNSYKTVGVSDFALYFNDNWRVTPKLTINLGLRYDSYAPLRERFNRMNRGYAFGLPNPIEAQAQANYARAPILELPVLRVEGGPLFAGVGGVSERLNERDNNNFGPRLGIAYSFDSRTVVRAGYGLSYKRTEIVNEVSQFGYSRNTPWVSTIDGITPLNLASNAYPDGILQPYGSSQGLLTAIGQNYSFFETLPRTPYVQAYQGSVQREVASNVMVEAAYIGNVAQRIVITHGLNAMPASYLELQSRLNQQVVNPFFGLIAVGPLASRTTSVGQLLKPFPQYTGDVNNLEHVGRSWHHGLRLKVEKRFSLGFSFLASYSVSKTMSKMGYLNDSDTDLERVLSALDSPQRLVISGLWELPFGRGKPFSTSLPIVGRLIEGWQVNAITMFNSGFPLAGFANAVSTGHSAKLQDPTIDRWFDTTAFVVQSPFTLRTLSSRLPDVRSDTYKNLDFSLMKNTQITEGVQLQFRAEAFNALNTPIFGAPNTNVQGATFGQINAQANTPREIQLGIKLIF